MKVYRVENRFGIGPYKAGVMASIATGHYRSNLTHPGPGVDGIKWNWTMEEYFCGFSSLNRLNKWFAGYQVYLRELGFVIGVYEVDEIDIFRGRIQLMFKMSMSIRLRSIKLSNKRIEHVKGTRVYSKRRARKAQRTI